MHLIQESIYKKQTGISKKLTNSTTDDTLRHLAFDNTALANIISTVSNGKVIMANKSACKLLGYSRKELLTKNRAAIFDINESSFKKMLKQRSAEGQSAALITAIQKSGRLLPCEITSAVFIDEDGIEKAITTIADMSQSILKQQEIDKKKEKIVADNIVLAESKQKSIDIEKDKIVADNIALAKSKQKDIDAKKEKTVADNIVLAESKQKSVDIKKDKIVADNIALAKSKQKDIDAKKEKTVADNIVLAESKQKSVDIKKDKIVADNIALAKSKQKDIDAKKEKIVADNIVLAESKQKSVDIKKDKIVADNIALAKSKQKDIDAKKEKTVADNIVLAESKQKSIDIKKDKIVADNIILAQEKSDTRLADNTEWVKYIAKASYDVMWDWNVVTGQIYVGDSIEEVFGYKVKNNTIRFSDLTKELFSGETEKAAKNLTKVLSSGSKSWSDSHTIKRFDGSVAAVTSRASIVRDKKGKAIRLIGATQDVSRLQELEKKLKEHITIHKEDSEKFLLTAKLSFDVIWDWNLLTGEVFIGEGFEELFGYRIKNNKGDMQTDWGNHLHPDDKEAIEKELWDAIKSSAGYWEHAYRIFRADGSIAKVYVRASIIRHANGKAFRMIGAMQDLSRQKELEEKLDHEIADKGKLFTEYQKNFKLIFNSSSDVLYDIDLLANKLVLSDAYEKEFGYKITDNMSPVEDWTGHIHADDRKAVIHDYQRMLSSDATEWKYSYRFLRADNSVANVLSSAIILRNADGKAYRMIGSMQDITKQKMLEERLEHEIVLKEKQITEAMEEAKETERSDIGKELHDNVNQLLGVSRVYLDMAKRGGTDTEMYLSRSSEYTLSAIEEIRKLSKGLTTDIIKSFGLCEAIKDIAYDTMEVNPIKITCALESFTESSVNNKFKLNTYRIVQEQLNNILKHAKATEVRISLVQTKKFIVLGISDNGVGFDTGKKQKGIGIANIKSRAAFYSGNTDFVSEPGAGCVLTVTFPVTDVLLNKS